MSPTNFTLALKYVLQEDRPLVLTEEERMSYKQRGCQGLLTVLCSEGEVNIPDPQQITSGWIPEEAFRKIGICNCIKNTYLHTV